MIPLPNEIISAAAISVCNTHLANNPSQVITSFKAQMQDPITQSTISLVETFGTWKIVEGGQAHYVTNRIIN